MNEKITGDALAIVSFLMSENIDKKATWDLSLHREKRSLDSNAYFHTLCDKLRLKLGISMARCKNILIGDYGQVYYLEDGEPMIYKTNAPEEYMAELETIHTKCIKITEENGKPVYFYRVYRGSHTYNTSEMHKLIEGTIQECLAQGDIQVATPAEIAHMEELWERKYGRQHEQEHNPE